MARTAPPAYAWDWFARQRLLWREVRSRLSAASTTTAARYGSVETRGEVIALLRADYPYDDTVRTTVDAVVTEVAFLGRTDHSFGALGARNAPRGMRWWWSALTGEVIDAPPRRDRTGPAHQLVIGGIDEPPRTLDDVHEGYGD